MSALEKYRMSIDARSADDHDICAHGHKGYARQSLRRSISMAGHNEYSVDPFSAQKGLHSEEDYVDFRSMGWIKAFLVATAEVGDCGHRGATRRARSHSAAGCFAMQRATR